MKTLLRNRFFLFAVLLTVSFRTFSQPVPSWETKWSNGGGGQIGSWTLAGSDRYTAGTILPSTPSTLVTARPSEGWAMVHYYTLSNTWSTKWSNAGNGWIGPGGATGWHMGSEDLYLTLPVSASQDYLLALNYATGWWATFRMYYDRVTGYYNWIGAGANGGGGWIGGWAMSSSDAYTIGNLQSSTVPYELLCVRASNGWAMLQTWNGTNFTSVWSNGGSGSIGSWVISADSRYVVKDFDGDGNQELLCLKPNWAAMFRFDGANWVGVWSNTGSGYIGGWNLVGTAGYVGARFKSNDNRDELLCLNTPSSWAMLLRYTTATGWTTYWSNGGSGVIGGWTMGSDRYFGNSFAQTPAYQQLLTIRPAWAMVQEFRLQTTITSPVTDYWNMTSIPCVVSNFLATAVYPTATSPVYRFNTTTHQYEAMTTLSNDQGYWLRFGSAQNISYQGEAIELRSIPVGADWNIVGTISYNVQVSSIKYSTPGMLATPYFKYVNGQYIPVDALVPGVGYWVKYYWSGSITLENTGAGAVASVDRFGSLDKFTIKDARGREQDLYVRNKEIPFEFDELDLPPRAPDADFDARYDGGEFVKGVETGDQCTHFAIDVATDAYPITLSWDIKPSNDLVYSVRSGEPGDASITISTRTGSIIMASPRSIGLSAKSSRKPIGVPSEYLLQENYPNPFNPSTELRFDLPEPADVSLIIYDMLGRQVAELANGNYEAGYHSATWNASDLASGVYLARFNVVNQLGNSVYTKTNKLVLMK